MELEYISFLRFSLQLMITETIFIINWKKKSSFFVRILLAMVGYWGLASGTFFLFCALPGGYAITYTLYYATLFFFILCMMKVCFQVDKKEILFAGVCGYATQHIGFAIYTIFSELVPLKLPFLLDFLLLWILPYILVAGIVYFVFVKRYLGKGDLVDKDFRMILLSLIILFTVLFLSVLVDLGKFTENAEILRNVFCKIYALLCGFLAIFVAFSISRQNRVVHENELMEQMLHNMEEQQKMSRESIDIINIKCHDLKYRLKKIPLIEDEQEQQEYIDEIRNAITIYDNYYQTGNRALDLVLTEKSLICEEKKIKSSCMVDGNLLNFMHSTDVYALFGNLLDNAIECLLQEKDEKRILSVQVNRQNDGCHIHIENYCSKEIDFEDGLPLTTKKDKSYHGFGVRSVKYIVEKYHGNILMRKVNQKFQTDIIFFER